MSLQFKTKNQPSQPSSADSSGQKPLQTRKIMDNSGKNEFICNQEIPLENDNFIVNSSSATKSNILVINPMCDYFNQFIKTTHNQINESKVEDYSLFYQLTKSKQESTPEIEKKTPQKLNPLAKAFVVPSRKSSPCRSQMSLKDDVTFSNIGYEVALGNVISGEDKRTTLMIKNIPNKYTLKSLKEELDGIFGSYYDFLYLPLDPMNKCNKGYAFINIINHLQIPMLFWLFQGKKWTKFQSFKKCEFSYAKIQGLNDLRTHFVRSLSIEDNKLEDNMPLFITNSQAKAFNLISKEK